MSKYKQNFALLVGAFILVFSSAILADPMREDVEPFGQMTKFITIWVWMILAGAWYGVQRWQFLKPKNNLPITDRLVDSVKHATIAAGLIVGILMLGAELYERMELLTGSIRFEILPPIGRSFMALGILAIPMLAIFAALKLLQEQTNPGTDRDPHHSAETEIQVDYREDAVATKLPPYALVIAEVVECNRGEVCIRYRKSDGQEDTIWMDKSNVALLEKEDAGKISKQWSIGIPK